MSEAQKDRVRKRFFTASVSDAHKPRMETTTNASRNSSFSIEARETGTREMRSIMGRARAVYDGIYLA